MVLAAMLLACGSCANPITGAVDLKKHGPPVGEVIYLPVGCSGETVYTPAENERLRFAASTAAIDGTKVTNPLDGITGGGPGLIAEFPLAVVIVRVGEGPWMRMKDQMRLNAGVTYGFRVNVAGRLVSGTVFFRIDKED